MMGPLHPYVDESYLADRQTYVLAAVRRKKIITAVAELAPVSVVVVGVATRVLKQERARRHCLGELLHTLDGLGVTQVWLYNRSHGRRETVDGFEFQFGSQSCSGAILKQA